MKKDKGKLIAIEGISCSGKTTLVKKLEKLFVNDDFVFLGGYDIRPYSSEFTKLSNKLSKKMPYFDLPLIVEFHFFISEILYDIEKIIKPALIDGKNVIYDNYWQSIYIIESSIALINNDHRQSKKYCKYIKRVKSDIEKIFDIIKPDLIIYVDSNIDITIDRMKKRNNNDFDEDYIYKLQNNIYNLYKKYLKNKNVYILKNNFDEKLYDKKIIEIYEYLKRVFINE